MSDIYLNVNLNINCKKLKIKESDVYNMYRYCTVYLKYTIRDINLKKVINAHIPNALVMNYVPSHHLF